MSQGEGGVAVMWHKDDPLWPLYIAVFTFVAIWLTYIAEALTTGALR